VAVGIELGMQNSKSNRDAGVGDVCANVTFKSQAMPHKERNYESEGVKFEKKTIDGGYKPITILLPPKFIKIF